MGGLLKNEKRCESADKYILQNLLLKISDNVDCILFFIIFANDCKCMKHKGATIFDISKRLGISASTVSRALNGSKLISEQTRNKVIEEAKKIGFRPNPFAVALKTGKTKTIGMIVPLINRNYFVEAIAGVEETIYAADYDLIIASSGNFYSREKKIVESMAQGKVVGVIAAVAAETTNYDHYKILIDNGIPVVMFDRLMPLPGMSSVVQDDFQGAYNATNHLIQQGCRKIFHYRGLQNVSMWNAREKGYRQEMADAGIEISKNWVHTALTTPEEGAKYAERLILKGTLPDAILFSGDFAAKAAMEVFAANGVNIPKDIAIVGFVNEPWDKYLTPPLSSVEQFPYNIGREAGRLMLNAINGEPPQKIVYNTELIIRESSLKYNR